MADEFGNYPMGLRNIKLKRGTTVVSLPAPQTMKFSENVVNATLKGGDKIVSAQSYPESASWDLEAGGISLDAWALMTGRTVTESGTHPNAQKSVAAKASDNFPWFEVFGQSLGDAGDDVWLHFPKCKLTKAPEGTLKGGDYFVTALSGMAIDDDVLGIYEVVQHETITTLPADNP